MGRWIAIAIGLVALLVFLGVSRIDAIARSLVERGSTQALQLETRIDSAGIGLSSGSFQISGLEVDNPAGYPHPHFLVIDAAELDLDLGTLLEPVVVAPSLTIQGVDVDLDKRGGVPNFEVVLGNLATTESEDSPEEPAAGEAEPGKRFVIGELVIRDVNAYLRLLEARGEGRVNVVVPEVRVTNLGGEGDPLTAAQLTRIIVKAILASILKAGAGLPASLAHALTTSLGPMTHVNIDFGEGAKVVDAAGNAVDAGANAVTGAADRVEKRLEGLGDRLSGD